MSALRWTLLILGVVFIAAARLVGAAPPAPGERSAAAQQRARERSPRAAARAVRDPPLTLPEMRAREAGDATVDAAAPAAAPLPEAVDACAARMRAERQRPDAIWRAESEPGSWTARLPTPRRMRHRRAGRRAAACRLPARARGAARAGRGTAAGGRVAARPAAPHPGAAPGRAASRALRRPRAAPGAGCRGLRARALRHLPQARTRSAARCSVRRV